MLPKPIVSCETSLKKSKNIAPERTKIAECRHTHTFGAISQSAVTAAAAVTAAEVVSSTPARTLGNHAPGARMTVV